MSLEEEYYQRSAFWDADIFKQGFEYTRLSMCLKAVPDSASSILNVGAGNGAFLSMIERDHRHTTCTGIERSTAAIAHAVCQSKIAPGDITSLPFDEHSFDLVCALEVIEHIPYQDYEQALSELSRVTKRYILLSVPYKENRLLTTCPYCHCRFNPHYHMRSFSDETLLHLFPGFRVRNILYANRDVSIIKAALNPIRRNVFGGFPSHCLCPQCGYFKDGRNEGPVHLRSHGKLHKLIKYFMHILPKTKVPSVVITLYERI